MTFGEIFVQQMQDLNLMSLQQCPLELSIFCNPFSQHVKVPNQPFQRDPWHQEWLGSRIQVQEH